jgi:NTP pyrophosphatase (non-canonical NTP hydrolase)
MFDVDEDVLERALDEWGIDLQADKAEEEAAEFIVASKHFGQGKVDEENVVEEVADVMVMVEQLALWLGRERVQEKIDEKLEDTEQCLSEHNP